MIGSMADSVVELPTGVWHQKTIARAHTWDAYEALREEDGWSEESAENIGEPDTRWKEATIREQWITVLPPVEQDEGLAW